MKRKSAPCHSWAHSPPLTCHLAQRENPSPHSGRHLVPRDAPAHPKACDLTSSSSPCSSLSSSHAGLLTVPLAPGALSPQTAPRASPSPPSDLYANVTGSGRCFLVILPNTVSPVLPTPIPGFIFLARNNSILSFLISICLPSLECKQGFSSVWLSAVAPEPSTVPAVKVFTGSQTSAE